MPTECRVHEPPTPPLKTNTENGRHVATNLAMAEPTAAQPKTVELDDATASPCDKRKLSPDISPEQQANSVVKKLKDTKTQPGKCD